MYKFLAMLASEQLPSYALSEWKPNLQAQGWSFGAAAHHHQCGSHGNVLETALINKVTKIEQL